MDKALLFRVLNKEASEEEQKQFYHSLKNDADDKALFLEAKKLWLRISINKTKVNLDEEYEELWKKIKESESRVRSLWASQMVKYAALFLLTLCLGGVSGYYLFQNKFGVFTQEYISQNGSVSTIQLSDGTKIWLNSKTRLNYIEDRRNNTRHVELEGEAYFDIEEGKSFPFEISVRDIIIKDIGTAFNVKAYKEDDFVTTSLVEGLVEILNSTGKSLVSIKPGESVVYNPENRKMEVKEISSNVLSSWRNGKFVFMDNLLEDIFKELERWYDIKIKTTRSDISKISYTGNLKRTTSVENVMKMLSLSAGFKYEVAEGKNGQTVFIIY